MERRRAGVVVAMIDLVLRATSRAALVTWGKTNPPGRPLVEEVHDGEGGTRNVIRPGLEWSPWGGTGQVMTAAGTYDENGDELTPPTYVPGFVALMRVHSEFFDWDRLDEVPADPDDVKEWERSKIAKYIKDNGTPGSLAGGELPYYELDGVQIFRKKDVDAFLAARGFASHGFL
jgi:hypothetical protein